MLVQQSGEQCLPDGDGRRAARCLPYPEGIDADVDFKDRTQAAFVVPKEDIAAQKYDLSINRYKEVVYQAEEYEDPKVILKRLKDLEKEILVDLEELEGML